MALKMKSNRWLRDRSWAGCFLAGLLLLSSCGDSAHVATPSNDFATYTDRFVSALAFGYDRTAAGLPDLVVQSGSYTPPPFGGTAILKYTLYEMAFDYFEAVLPELSEEEQNFFYEAFRLSYLWEAEIAGEKKVLGPWYEQSELYRGDTEFAAYTSAVADVAILMACRRASERTPQSALLSLLYFGAYQELLFEELSGNLWYQYPGSDFNPVWTTLYRGGQGPGRGVDVPITLIPQAVWITLALDAHEMVQRGAPVATEDSRELWAESGKYRAQARRYVEELRDQGASGGGALVEALIAAIERGESLESILKEILGLLSPQPAMMLTDAQWQRWATDTVGEVTQALRQSSADNLEGDAPVSASAPEFTRFMAALGFPEALEPGVAE